MSGRRGPRTAAVAQTTATPATAAPTWDRLEDQIAWYDNESRSARHAHRRLRVLELVAAAAVPALASAQAAAWATAGAGGIVLILQGLQQLVQHHHNWITYRSTCEALKREKFLYLAACGPYSEGSNRDRLLAEQIERLVCREHAKWVSSRQEHHTRPAGIGGHIPDGAPRP